MKIYGVGGFEETKTADNSIVMLCHEVAVAVFPMYMGVYVSCLFLPAREPAGAAR